MRNLLTATVGLLREMSPEVRAYYGSWGNADFGVFNVPTRRSQYRLRCIASKGEGWEHVSVSLPDRVPDWGEMEHVKRLFFEDDEIAVQFHVPPAQHISVCHTCLHLWRPLEWKLKLPPSWMVA